MSSLQNKKRPIILILMIALTFLIFNPFGKNDTAISPGTIPVADEEQLEKVVSALQNYHMAPDQFLISLFEENQFVLLGEYQRGNIKQHLDFLQSLVPELHNAGVYNIAVEFALSKDQGKIDAVLNADTYNAAGVNEILLNFMSVWGYTEYAEVFKTVYQFNFELSSSEAPMRIIGLAPDLNYEYFKTEDDLSDNGILKQVHNGRSKDQSMASVVLTLLRDEKALIYTKLTHSFSRYQSDTYKEKILEIGFSEYRYMGSIIKAAADTATVLLHSPWMDSSVDFGASYSANGIFDNVMREVEPRYQTSGFSVTVPPFSEIEVVNKDLVEERTSLKLSDLCDGYVLLGLLENYSAGDSIPDFITDQNIDAAKKQFPGPKEGLDDVTSKEFNDFIKGNVDWLNTHLDNFQ